MTHTANEINVPARAIMGDYAEEAAKYTAYLTQELREGYFEEPKSRITKAEERMLCDFISQFADIKLMSESEFIDLMLRELGPDAEGLRQLPLELLIRKTHLIQVHSYVLELLCKHAPIKRRCFQRSSFPEECRGVEDAEFRELKEDTREWLRQEELRPEQLAECARLREEQEQRARLREEEQRARLQAEEQRSKLRREARARFREEQRVRLQEEQRVRLREEARAKGHRLMNLED